MLTEECGETCVTPYDFEFLERLLILARVSFQVCKAETIADGETECPRKRSQKKYGHTRRRPFFFQFSVSMLLMRSRQSKTFKGVW